jgi:hypothetical protein
LYAGLNVLYQITRPNLGPQVGRLEQYSSPEFADHGQVLQTPPPVFECR